MARAAVHSKLIVRGSLLLIGLAWTLPFLQPYHRFPLTGFYSEWLALALGLAAALVLLDKDSWNKAAVPAVAVAPIGLIVVLGLQVALGRVPYAEQALTAALYLLWTAVLILLGHVLRREIPLATAATMLAWFLFAGGVLGAAVGLLQHYQISTPVDFLIGRTHTQSVYGNLGQPNHYAGQLSFALVSASYLYARRSLHGALAGGCIALLLLLLALAGSRSTWLYLGALTVLALLLHHRRRDADSRRTAVVAAWLLPGFVVAHWVSTLPFMAPADGAFVTSLERLFQVASGIEPRLQLWREAWQMFLGAPVLGAGWGQFAWHHFLYQAATGATAAPGVYNHAHNAILHLMAESGALGTLIVVGAVLLWLTDLKGVKFDLERWWQLALLAVIGIHSMLEYPLWYAYFLGVAALLLGLGAERVFILRLAGAARMVVGLGIVAGWLNLVAVLPSYRDFELLVFIPQRSNSPPLDEEAFSRAIAGIHREPLLAPYVEFAVAYGVTLTEESLPEKLIFTARATHFAPVPVVVYRHALLLALAGEREAALAQLEQSLRVYPEEAGDVVAQLEALASRRPAGFAPLLELAKARSADLRARSPIQ